MYSMLIDDLTTFQVPRIKARKHLDDLLTKPYFVIVETEQEELERQRAEILDNWELSEEAMRDNESAVSF